MKIPNYESCYRKLTLDKKLSPLEELVFEYEPADEISEIHFRLLLQRTINWLCADMETVNALPFTIEYRNGAHWLQTKEAKEFCQMRLASQEEVQLWNALIGVIGKAQNHDDV